MATDSDGYMLRRDSEESKRLDVQHAFFRCLSSGHLLHPSLPIKNIASVADVGAGTGIWLRQVASSSEFANRSDRDKQSFVGFDVSPKQYPTKEEISEPVKLEVHDFYQPFPKEYDEKFDLVNVRFVSYVLQLAQLENVVRNILQILRPGGYLQWQECDAGDSWTTPENPTSTSTINYVIAEKVSRGLLPGIATPLIRTIQSLQIELLPGQQNIESRSNDMMRIRHLETISTAHHSDPQVAVGKKFGVISAASVLLESSINRNKAAAESATGALKEKLERDVQAMTALMEAIKRGEGDAINNWDFEMTWIVARKALVLDEEEPWMAKKYPTS
jgi:SAM-dependent methyltransferase